MKFIAKTNLINIVFGSIFLATGGIIFYSLFVRTMNEEVNEKLLDNKNRIVALIKEKKPVASIPPVIEYEKLGSNPSPSLLIHDTILFDPISGDHERFREVTSLEEIDGEYYKITARQVILERHDYLENIGSGFLIIWLMLNIGLLILTLTVSRKLWTPFRKNLDKLKKFRVTDQTPIVFNQSSTREFKELTKVMVELTEKVRGDYKLLKEFSENATHEIQTPLAIIQAKLEDALQNPGIDPAIGERIEAALASSNRLSRLVQSLLLLAKIENNQFVRKEWVEADQVISSVLNELNEFIEAKDLRVETKLEKIVLMVDSHLLDILITNLITNSIRYNTDKGWISIDLNSKRLRIINPSLEKINNSHAMFDRFVKGNKASSSHGLGLAIVKKICDQQNWKVTYNVVDSQHILEIAF